MGRVRGELDSKKMLAELYLFLYYKCILIQSVKADIKKRDNKQGIPCRITWVLSFFCNSNGPKPVWAFRRESGGKAYEEITEYSIHRL